MKSYIDYEKLFELETKICVKCDNRKDCKVRTRCNAWNKALSSLIIEHVWNEACEHIKEN